MEPTQKETSKPGRSNPRNRAGVPLSVFILGGLFLAFVLGGLLWFVSLALPELRPLEPEEEPDAVANGSSALGSERERAKPTRQDVENAIRDASDGDARSARTLLDLLQTARPKVSGRLLLEGGIPFALQTLEVGRDVITSEGTEEHHAGPTIRTDSDGKFLLETDPWHAKLRLSLHGYSQVIHFESAEVPLSFEVIKDLGEITASTATLVASGRIEEGGGGTNPKNERLKERLVSDADDNERHRPFFAQDKAGNFAIYSGSGASEFGIELYVERQASNDVLGRSGLRWLPRGARNETFKIRRYGWLEGRVRLPEGYPLTDFRLFVVDASKESSSPKSFGERVEEVLPLTPEGTFGTKILEGQKSLWAPVGGEDGLSSIVPDLLIQPGGEATVVAPIDLRKLHGPSSRSLRVIDARTKAPVARASVQMVLSGLEELPVCIRRGVTDHEGRITLSVTSAPTSIEIEKRDFLIATLSGEFPRSEIQVVLHRPFVAQVRIKPDDWSSLDPSHVLGIRLHPAGSPQGQAAKATKRVEKFDGFVVVHHVAESSNLFSSMKALQKDWPLLAHFVEPGLYESVVSLMRLDLATLDAPSATLQVTPVLTPQIFDLPLPQTLWKAAESERRIKR